MQEGGETVTNSPAAILLALVTDEKLPITDPSGLMPNRR